MHGKYDITGSFAKYIIMCNLSQLYQDVLRYRILLSGLISKLVF